MIFKELDTNDPVYTPVSEGQLRLKEVFPHFPLRLSTVPDRVWEFVTVVEINGVAQPLYNLWTLRAAEPRGVPAKHGIGILRVSTTTAPHVTRSTKECGEPPFEAE